MTLKAWLGLETYISELDQLLLQFDHRHPQLSEAQWNEKEKYTRLYRQRDRVSDEKRE